METLRWGRKAVGVRVVLCDAAPPVVRALMRDAWCRKAPAALRRQDLRNRRA